MEMDRREFLLQTGAGAAITATAGTAAGSQSGETTSALEAFQPDGYRAPEWLRFPRAVYFDGYSPPFYPRLSDFDAEKFVRCVVEVGGNCLRNQPIGYWAYYPSQAYPPHPDLGNRDTIDEVAKECRKAKIHHYCYTGYGHPFFEPGWAEKHGKYADWIMRDINGKPTGTYWHLGWINRQKTCLMADAYREAIRQVVKELCDHDTEGIYFDAPSNLGYHGICFCNSCRRNYKKVSGFEIERLQDDNDGPAKLAWYKWVNQVTAEDLSDFRKIIHGSGKFMMCHNGPTWRGTSLPLQYRIPDGFMVEAALQTYERLMHGFLGASMARPYKKLNHMYLGGYNTSSFNQPPHLAPWTSHNSNLEDTDEIRMDGYTNLAAGGVPMYACLNRLYYKIGSGSSAPVSEIFDFMRHHEALLRETIPVAQVSVVPTWESLQLYRNIKRKINSEATSQDLRRDTAIAGRSFNMEMSEGFLLAMLDAHVSADVCPSTEVSEEWLGRQKVVALCGASGLSANTVSRLSKWVEAGGGLLATYDTGMYGAEGEMRSDGGALRELLGVQLRGTRLRAQPDCYYKVLKAHPALGSLKEGTLVQGDNTLLPIAVSHGATVLASVYNIGSGETRGPAIVHREVGRGRCIYVSGSLESHYPSSRVRSIRTLLADLVRYLAKDSPDPFRIQSPVGVYGILRDSASGGRLLWLLAPVGSQDQAAGRMRREYVPARDVRVSIMPPHGKQVKSIRLLRSGKGVNFHMEGQYATVTLPELHIAEVIHMEIT